MEAMCMCSHIVPSTHIHPPVSTCAQIVLFDLQFSSALLEFRPGDSARIIWAHLKQVFLGWPFTTFHLQDARLKFNLTGCTMLLFMHPRMFIFHKERSNADKAWYHLYLHSDHRCILSSVTVQRIRLSHRGILVFRWKLSIGFSGFLLLWLMLTLSAWLTAGPCEWDKKNWNEHWQFPPKCKHMTCSCPSRSTSVEPQLLHKWSYQQQTIWSCFLHLFTNTI